MCYSSSTIQKHVDLDLCSDCSAQHLCDLGQETSCQSLAVSVWRMGVAATSFRISQWHCNASCSPNDQVNKTGRNAKWQELRKEIQDNGRLPSNKYVSGWLHQCNKHELGQTPGDGKGQGGLAWCSPWGCKESFIIGQLNNNSNKYVSEGLEHKFLSSQRTSSLLPSSLLLEFTVKGYLSLSSHESLAFSCPLQQEWPVKSWTSLTDAMISFSRNWTMETHALPASNTLTLGNCRPLAPGSHDSDSLDFSSHPVSASLIGRVAMAWPVPTASPVFTQLHY